MTCNTRVVYCGVSSPYPSPAHSTKVDDSRGVRRNCNAPRIYTRRGRDIIGICASVVETSQHDDVIARYDEDEGRA
jgi:hypothetical protein